MEFEECACNGKSLGRLVQPAIAALLAEEPAHGYVLVQRLAEMSMFRCQKPDPTGVYRTLRAMEEDGLVVSALDFGDAGPAKRRFELTDNGQACLSRWTQTLEQYAASIEELLVTIRNSGTPRRKG